MNDAAKIALSPEEAELVMNTGWILTKQQITGKVYELMGAAAADLQRLVTASGAVPEAVRLIPPKIARGENYRQLPYLMLDYPRLFDRQDTLAIRTFFWWGHYFSVNLQVSGCWLPGVEAKLREQSAWLAEQGYHICIHTDPWEQAFEPQNYMPLSEWIGRGKEPAASAHGFLKTGRFIRLDQWEDAPRFIRESAEQLLTLLPGYQAPSL